MDPLELRLFDCASPLKYYSCPKCSYFQTNFLQHLKHHIVSGHVLNTFAVTMYRCAQCSFLTHSKYINAQHSQFNCPRLQSSRSHHVVHRDTDPLEIAWSKCDKCPSKFKLAEDLRIHMQKHKAWTCQLCHARLFCKTSFHRHMFRKHRETVFYMCRLCPFKTHHKPSLERHRQRQHYKAPVLEKKFQCEQCPSKFRKKEYLEKHLKWIHAAPGSVEWEMKHRCTLIA